jgi:heme exporter protein A
VLDVKEALLRLGLESKGHLLAGLLSTGQKQRLALAKLCLGTTRLWILDEPFSSLDSDGILLTQQLMCDHLSKKGMIVLTSHQPLTKKIDNYSELELIPNSDIDCIR